MSLNKGSAKKDEHIIIRQLDFGLEEVANSGSDNESSHLSASGKKINKYLLRKASDTDFQYYCEWNDCQQVKHTMNEFNHHISVHLQSYRQHLGSIAQQGTGGFCFACPWRECNATIQGQMDDFSRHIFYHTFHQYLKFLGLHIQKVDKLNSCTLDTSSRNVIPELPEKLMCRWSDCGLVYDNPYIFYSHVSHHCEDYPKGSNSKIKCLWEGFFAV
ncbi:hypothetical protein Btru_064540 [Bulinus truncatus]|nr:hypothetical protein Btru_064540 [Bulinus truncatus]